MISRDFEKKYRDYRRKWGSKRVKVLQEHEIDLACGFDMWLKRKEAFLETNIPEQLKEEFLKDITNYTEG